MRRALDGATSHVLTTPHEAHAYREAERILGELKNTGQHHGITAVIMDTDSANQPPFDLSTMPRVNRGIIVPKEIEK